MFCSISLHYKGYVYWLSKCLVASRYSKRGYTCSPCPFLSLTHELLSFWDECCADESDPEVIWVKFKTRFNLCCCVLMFLSHLRASVCLSVRICAYRCLCFRRPSLPVYLSKTDAKKSVTEFAVIYDSKGCKNSVNFRTIIEAHGVGREGTRPGSDNHPCP